MSILVPIHRAAFGAETLPTVNARELHAFLRVGRDFSNWVKERLDKYGFAEGQDYVTVRPSEVFAKFGENPKGGRPALDYHLTLDVAKELSMVENNEQGRQARRYFIEAEKRLKGLPALDQATAKELEALKASQEVIKDRLIELQDYKIKSLEAQLTPKHDPVPQRARRPWLTEAEKRRIVELFNAGQDRRSIAVAVGCSHRSVGRALDWATSADQQGEQA